MSLIRDLLREYLLHGGPRLAHEYALCRQLGCSRNVLREALSLLAADGLVDREHGRGTHVLTASLGLLPTGAPDKAAEQDASEAP